MKILTIVDSILTFVWLTYWHLKSLLNIAPSFWRFCYNACNSLFTKLQYTSNIDVSFMNYGYAIKTPHSPPENSELDKFIESKLEKLKKDSPPNFNDVWNSVQLYTAVLSTYDDDFKGKSILEVGCGRGGGSVVVCSVAEPMSYAGIDISDQGIELCRQIYRNDLIPAGNKVFYVGSSMELENYFAPESFDVVLNVESAHCYPNFDKFVKGVFDLLKPGGMMLFADISPTIAWPDIKDTIANTGFQIVKQHNITANVIYSLKTEVEPFLSKINSKSSSSYIGRALMWLVNSQTVRIPLNAMIKGEGQYHIIASKKPVQFNKSKTIQEEKTSLRNRRCSSFKLKQDVFTKIQNETSLSTKQIKDFYNTFISNSDNGFMDIRRFRMVLGLLDDGLLSQMIFNAMDTDNNNLLDFYEFGRTLAIMISENFDEKARFSYRVMRGEDHMGLSDGITFEKLLKSIRAIDNARYMLVGPHILNFSDQEIRNFFNNYSTVKDGQNEPKIYFENYKMAIQDSPEFLSFFGIITPIILESYDLDIDNRKPPLKFEGINIFNRPPIDRVEYIESIEKELTSQLKLQIFDILEDIKSIKQETSDSLNTLEKWICSPKENNLLNCMLFDINNNSDKFEVQNFTDTNNAADIFTYDMLLLKSVLNNNIEMLDSIYKKSIYSLQNRVPLPQTIIHNNMNSGIVKKVYNRRKMYINKGNVAPNTKHRMSASEMIKKTFMHKSSSTLDYSRNSYCSNNRKRVSLIHTYRRRSNISGGFQNMAKVSSKIKVKGSKTNLSSTKSKYSHSEKETPTISGINVPAVKITKGYAVYIGHESWNTVLNMMVGMRLAIGRVYSEPNRNVADYDFIMKEKFFIIPRTSRASNTKSNILVQKGNDYRGFVKPVQFIDYNPMVFRKIREICNISPESYVRSVGPEQLLGNMVLGNLSSMNELCSEGKSGAFFYYTADGRFLIKTVGKKTAVFFRSILSKYFNHIESNHNSLITRIYGLHALRFKKPLLQPFNTLREQISSNSNSILRKKSKIHKIFFIVMENIFHTPVEIHRRYDIKGSWIGRSTPLILQEDTTIALKELDMKNNKEMLHINQQDKIDLLKQLEIDCRFFELYNIMDYSLLIGIHYVKDDSLNIESLIENKNNRKFVGILSSDRRKVYYLGFIDFFSTWSTIKKFERLYKAITIGSSNGISAVPPDKYSMRFMKFIESKISE